MHVFKGNYLEQSFESLEQLNNNWTRLQVFDRFLALKKGKSFRELQVYEDSPRMKIKKDKLRRVMLKAWEYLEDGTAQTKSEALRMAWKWSRTAKEKKRAAKFQNQIPLL